MKGLQSTAGTVNADAENLVTKGSAHPFRFFLLSLHTSSLCLQIQYSSRTGTVIEGWKSVSENGPSGPKQYEAHGLNLRFF